MGAAMTATMKAMMLVFIVLIVFSEVRDGYAS
jgi:hypothetical protein